MSIDHIRREVNKLTTVYVTHSDHGNEMHTHSDHDNAMHTHSDKKYNQLSMCVIIFYVMKMVRVLILIAHMVLYGIMYLTLIYLNRF